MSSNTLQIVIKARDTATRVIRGVARTLRKFAINPAFKTIAKSFNLIKKAIFSLKGAMVGLVAAWGIKSLAEKSLNAFMKMENALIGLSSVATKMGKASKKAMGRMTVDAETAKKAAIELTEDGLMGVDDAATGLKNLLLAGFGLKESVKMMKAFKDSAAFGRQGALSFGDAIRSATEGIKNENSILVDNAGITKNLSIMHKDYAASIGKTVGKLTEVEKRTAVYNGILEESTAMQGDAERMTKTYQGSVASLNNSMFMLYKSIGESLAPVMQRLIEERIKPAINSMKAWIAENRALIATRLEQALDFIGKGFEWIKKLLAEDAQGVSDLSRAMDDMWTVASPIVAGLKDGLVWIGEYLRRDSSNVSQFGRDISALSRQWDELKNVILEVVAAAKAFAPYARIIAAAAGGAVVGSIVGPGGTAAGALAGGVAQAGQEIYNSMNARDSEVTIENATLINTGTPQAAIP
jgi:hypothetical protein